MFDPVLKENSNRPLLERDNFLQKASNQNMVTNLKKRKKNYDSFWHIVFLAVEILISTASIHFGPRFQTETQLHIFFS